MTSLIELARNTKDDIKKITKPLSAYQYYTKHFREKWSNMSEDDKDGYLLEAKEDNQRYASEKQAFVDKQREEIKKLKIFLIRSHGRVPCVGLDNGFTNYHAMGPVGKVEMFTEEEKKKLETRGVLSKYIGQYKSGGGIKFNWRAAKKWNVKVYGGNTNSHDSWWTVSENYDGQTGHFTTYNNYKGDTWTTN